MHRDETMYERTEEITSNNLVCQDSTARQNSLQLNENHTMTAKNI